MQKKKEPRLSKAEINERVEAAEFDKVGESVFFIYWLLFLYIQIRYGVSTSVNNYRREQPSTAGGYVFTLFTTRGEGIPLDRVLPRSRWGTPLAGMEYPCPPPLAGMWYPSPTHVQNIFNYLQFGEY